MTPATTTTNSYRGYDPASKSTFGAEVVGECFGSDWGDKLAIVAGDRIIFDSSVDIVSGDIVMVTRTDGNRVTSAGLDGGAKYIEAIDREWWLRGEDPTEIFPLSASRHRVIGRAVQSIHYRPSPILNARLQDLHKASVSQPTAHREELLKRNAHKRAWLAKNGFDRTTVYRASVRRHADAVTEVKQQTHIDYLATATNISLYLLRPHLRWILLLLSPLLPERLNRWRQSL